MATCKTLVSALLCALYATLLASSLEGGGVMRNLAIRGAMLGASGGGVPTARDYVQDGLALMIDGIENAGFGNHVSSLSSWKNLASSGIMSDVSMSGDYAVGSNHVWMNQLAIQSRTSNGIGRCNVLRAFSTKTIEVCSSGFKPNHVTDSNRKNAFLSGPNTFGTLYYNVGNVNLSSKIYICLYSTKVDQGFISASQPNFAVSDALNLRCVSFNSSRGLVIDLEDLSSRVTINTSTDIFSGSVELFNRSSDWARPFNGKIHCMRVYDRNLTAEEMIINQKIDKERFG